jgi:hypothetical protein
MLPMLQEVLAAGAAPAPPLGGSFAPPDPHKGTHGQRVVSYDMPEALVLTRAYASKAQRALCWSSHGAALRQVSSAGYL